jgi:selenoprotein W-related protein
MVSLVSVFILFTLFFHLSKSFRTLSSIGKSFSFKNYLEKPKISIEYCPGCRWLLRSAWIAQEVLTTFEKEIGEVALKPSEITGTFKISVNEDIIWDRKNSLTSGFPELKELKQIIRDIVNPDRDLGHSDVKK